MIVLGADISYECSGFVWLDRVGSDPVIMLRRSEVKKFPIGPLRLGRVQKFVHSILKADRPDYIILEEEAKSSRRKRYPYGDLAYLHGVFIGCCELHGFVHGKELIPLNPTSLKKWATGSGRAEKYQISREIEKKLNISFPQDKGYNLSDACALAWWGMERRK